MRAVATNLIPEPAQSSEEPDQASALALGDSLARLPVVGAKEVQQLSRFLPIVLLIPKSSLTDGGVPHIVAASKSIAQKPEAGKLFGHFSEAIPQLKITSVESAVVFGDVAVNFSTMEASRKGKPVTLTAMEFKMLRYMTRNERRVLSRDELLNEVWGYESYPCTRTVDNHILRLRRKLEREPSRPIHFRTVHGVGYKFSPDQV